MGITLATLFKLLLVVIALGVALATGALLLNRLPWSQPPGTMQRLLTYLTTNVAATRPDSPFPELRTHHFPQGPMPLFLAINTAVQALGWEVAERDVETGTLHAVVATRWLHFKDDVVIRLVPATEGTAVEVRSASRVGRGDFGANTRHVMAFYAQLEQVLERSDTPPPPAASP